MFHKETGLVFWFDVSEVKELPEWALQAARTTLRPATAKRAKVIKKSEAKVPRTFWDRLQARHPGFQPPA